MALRFHTPNIRDLNLLEYDLLEPIPQSNHEVFVIVKHCCGNKSIFSVTICSFSALGEHYRQRKTRCQTTK